MGIAYFLLWLIGVNAALLYLINPLLVYSRTKMAVRPETQPFDPRSTPAGEALERYFAAVRSNLAKMGFEFLGYFTPSRLNAKSQLFIGAFHDPSTLDTALCTAVFNLVEDRFLLRTTLVEFTSKYEGGFEVDTSNNRAAGVFSKPPDRRIERVPTARNTYELWLVHRYLKGLYPQLPRVESPLGRDPVVFLNDLFQNAYTRQASRGYLKLDRKVNAFRPTLPGAFLMTWRITWPVKGIRLAAEKRRGKRLLALALAQPGLPPVGDFLAEGEPEKLRDRWSPIAVRRTISWIFTGFVVVTALSPLWTRTFLPMAGVLNLLCFVGLVVLWLTKPRGKAN